MYDVVMEDLIHDDKLPDAEMIKRMAAFVFVGVRDATEITEKGAFVRWFCGFMMRDYVDMMPIVHAIWPYIVGMIWSFALVANPAEAPMQFLRSFTSFYFLGLDCKRDDLSTEDLNYAVQTFRKIATKLRSA
jgi:hypothetical protein